MALRLGKKDEIPSGAVRLSKEEAVAYQFERIQKWKPQSEIWPLLYGSPLMGATSALSATIINDIFRRKCHLPKMGIFMVGMPIVLVSAVSMTLAHHVIVTSDIVIMDTKCMPCVQGRNALLLAFFGTVYPVIACSIGNMMTAEKLSTVKLPSLAKEPRQFFKTCQQMIQKKGNFFSGLFVVNIVVAVIAAHLQQKAAYRLNEAQ